jgi:putative two-component system hydrogenase maturation factor HypX/HoxX
VRRGPLEVSGARRGALPEQTHPRTRGPPVRIMLLCSAFNGLSQRAWIELRAAGHDVPVRLAGDAEAIEAAAAADDPDLIICPFLRERVPSSVWARYRTIIIHPGPVGDRGPSSLDWAITEGTTTWGVTALQAVDEMDAGPVWATRTFPLPADPPRKSALYNGPVADAAIAVIGDVVACAADAAFTPTPLEGHPAAVGRLRPAMRQAERAFRWSDPTARIVRHIRAADGAPGVHTTLAGVAVAVFDAHPGPPVGGAPGTIVGRRLGAVLVRTGDASVWIGHVRPRRGDGPPLKLPATHALADRLDGVPELLDPPGPLSAGGPRELTYERTGDVGVLTFDLHNGAMSTAQCRRLAGALRRALAADTRVLVLRGGEVFSNGIHLGVIEAADDPEAEAWRNIHAIDDVCQELLSCTDQLIVASIGGNAGAGGVMLALGADRVLLRDGVVLNPHYAGMGLFGSEYWTYVLPRRVGPHHARRLTTACQPVGAAEALAIGLVDTVIGGDRQTFEAEVLARATALAAGPEHGRLLAARRAELDATAGSVPLQTYRRHELAEMHADIFDDRRGFSSARLAFVSKQPRSHRTAPAASSMRNVGGSQTTALGDVARAARR